MSILDGTDDIFDSRDVIERIAELESEIGDNEHPNGFVMEREELSALQTFVDEASGYAPDWHYGATFIRDTYFEDYARELAEGIGAIDPEAGWPLAHIDWEAAADALKMDYSEVQFMGTDYWTRWIFPAYCSTACARIGVLT